MSAKLLAAHLAALSACAAAYAITVGTVSLPRDSTPVCNQIATPDTFAKDTLERPAGLVCIASHPEYRGIAITAAAVDEAVTLDIVPPAAVYVTPDEVRKLDLWFFTGCGLICFSVGGLRVGLGRKRHRPGVRKSVLRLRMMA